MPGDAIPVFVLVRGRHSLRKMKRIEDRMEGKKCKDPDPVMLMKAGEEMNSRRHGYIKEKRKS
jgi:hypothetical protein